MPTPTYVAIAKTVLTGTQSTVTISSIPQTYTDLLVVTSVRFTYPSVYTTWLTMRLNNDSSSSVYSANYILAQGSSVSSSRFASGAINRAYPYYTDGDLSTTNTFGSGEFYIPNYTSTSLSKIISATGVSETNDTTNNIILPSANLYTGSSAISSIVFTVVGATGMDSGSRFDLYGIKNS